MHRWQKVVTGVIGGGAAVAVATVAFAAPGLTVEQAQEQARVIARWSPRCDWRGCPDRYEVTWTRGTATVAQRTITARTDTLLTTWPALGDSVRVTVAVVAIRRTQRSTAVSQSTWLRAADAPPQPVDSLRVDTSVVSVGPLPPGYDRIAIRDTLGRRDVMVAPGGTVQWCGLLRNAATQQWEIGADPRTTPAEQAEIRRMCERARQVVAAERSG